MRFLIAAAVLLGWLAGTAAPAAAEDGYVKYYVVADGYAGKPETAAEVAGRFLGGAARAADIVRLNEGRTMSGGIGLTTAGQSLPAGWPLILPWDANGSEVGYGRLPEVVAAKTAAACGPAGPASAGGSWPDEVLGLDRVRSLTRGAGVLVAVVDSGVDRAVPGLAGRVDVGADLTTGRTGDSDCLGTGTAMAGLIASADGGVAPEARIFPVRVTSGPIPADPARVATGIEVALSAGARVIALGSYAGTSAPAVEAMVANAVAHDVLVVAPAGPEGSTPATDGVLRVGSIAAGGATADVSAAGVAEVTAPGVDVTVPGPGESGTRVASDPAYAVAYVAGTAALVRAAFPKLSAARAEQRITQTARGTGLLDPPAALAATNAPESGRVWVAAAPAAGVAIAAAAMFARRRRHALHPKAASLP
ncbi:S8 family serine peptidase [Paractinoplanes durhamensis]|uniref:S8 family serine peptidase n=1 Tax=Paractinoplanes durhamensis TaxID=113563 RepID=UPI0031CF466C